MLKLKDVAPQNYRPLPTAHMKCIKDLKFGLNGHMAITTRIIRAIFEFPLWSCDVSKKRFIDGNSKIALMILVVSST